MAKYSFLLLWECNFMKLWPWKLTFFPVIYQRYNSNKMNFKPDIIDSEKTIFPLPSFEDKSTTPNWFCYFASSLKKFPIIPWGKRIQPEYIKMHKKIRHDNILLAPFPAGGSHWGLLKLGRRTKSSYQEREIFRIHHYWNAN